MAVDVTSTLKLALQFEYKRDKIGQVSNHDRCS